MDIRFVLLSRNWLARFAPLLIFAFLFVTLLLSLVATDEVIRERSMADIQLSGTVVMFLLLPVYLLFCMRELTERSDRHLNDLVQVVPPDELSNVRSQITHLSPWAFLAMLLGVVFGALQNNELVTKVVEGQGSPLDVYVALSNCLIWVMVALVLAWRVPHSFALRRLGRVATFNTDLPQQLLPFSRIAMMDVLVVAGALVFMPLQSLDAEFRLHNYLPGFVIGFLAAIIFLLNPLLGAREVIQREKSRVLQRVEQDLSALEWDDFASRAPLVAYRDRILEIPSLPVDMAGVTRLLLYFVLPPIAWVTTAYLESLFS